MDSSQSIGTQDKNKSKMHTISTRSVSFKQAAIKEDEGKRSHSHSILKKRNNLETNQSSSSRKKNQGDSLSIKRFSYGQQCANIKQNFFTKNRYDKIIQMVSQDQKFQDRQFPPQDQFLYSLSNGAQKLGKTLRWMRISNLFKGKKKTIWDPLRPLEKLNQSTELCPKYLILALNCLRSNPNFLSKIFQGQRESQKGIFYVNLFVQNVWKTIIVDDYIPVFQKAYENGRKDYFPIFTAPTIRQWSHQRFSENLRRKYELLQEEPIEIWMLIIQKAFAKIYSGYQSLLFGNLFDFMTELTGYDYTYINVSAIQSKFKEKSQQKEYWSDYFSKEHLPRIFLGQKRSSSSQKNQCLNQGKKNENIKEERTHYQVFNFAQIRSQLIPITLLRGTFQKIAFLSSVENSRLFYRNRIWPEDVGTFFSAMYAWGGQKYEYWGICKIPATKQNILVRKFSLRKKSKTCISVYQRDRKYFAKNQKYLYSWIRVIVLQREYNGTYRWVNAGYSNLKSIQISHILSAGQYYILLLPEWLRDQHNRLDLVVKTCETIKIEQIVYEKGIVEEGCADLAQRFGSLNQLNKFLCSYNCIHEEIGLIIENINNQKVKRAIKIRRKVHEMRSGDISIKPFNQEFNETNILQVSIKPSSYFTVVIMMEGGIQTSFYQNFNFSH